MSENKDDPTEELRRDLEWLSSSLAPDPADLGVTFLSAAEIRRSAEHAEAQEAASLADVRRRRMRSVGTTMVVVLAAAAAVVVVVVAPWEGPGSGDHRAPIASTSSQSDVVYLDSDSLLLAAASSAAHLPDPGRAAYWHVKSEQRFGSDPVVPREVWHGHGRRGVLKQDGFVDHLPPARFPLLGELLSWEQVQSLPVRSKALANRIRAGASSPVAGDWYQFKAAGELLAEAPASPALREALWKVLAATKGVTFEGAMTDRRGRAGWAISLSSKTEGTATYLVDPVSGRLLETRLDPVRPGARPWTVTYLLAEPSETAIRVP